MPPRLHPPRVDPRAFLGAVSVAIFAALWATPGAAESPRSHDRHPERYEAMPLPGQSPSRPAAKGPGESFDPEQRRSGFYKPPPSKSDDVDDGKREMLGNERLWTTRDPAGKRGPFAFLGNRIGDPIENVFPDMQEKDQFGMPLCRDTAGLPGFLDCTDDSIREMVNGVWKLLYRGVEVSYLNYRYLDRKLVGFDMGFPTASFKALGDVLRRQYGPATAEEQSSLTHRLGGVFDIQTKSWNTPHGEMVLQSRGAALDAGSLSLMEPKAAARYADLRFRQVFVPAKPNDEPEGEVVIHPLKGDQPAPAPATSAPAASTPAASTPATTAPAATPPAAAAPAPVKP